MGERELGKALLDLDATSVVKGADVRRQTQVVLERDRRWLRLVTFATVAVWLLATFLGIMALAALCTMGLIMLSRRATLRHMNAGLLEIASELAQLRQTLAVKGT
jgi:hypothetical protein